MNSPLCHGLGEELQETLSAWKGFLSGPSIKNESGAVLFFLRHKPESAARPAGTALS